MIDARGYSCPEPVMMLRAAMETKKDTYEMLVDNRVSVENVTRYASHCGYRTDCQKEGFDFRLSFTRKEEVTQHA